MQVKLAKVVQKILIILIICILTMGDVIVIAENSAIMSISDEQNAEEIEKLEVKQTLITNKKYKIGEGNKNILQLLLEINTDGLETSSLKENKVTLTTPIQGVIPEEIYISKQDSVNLVDATWQYSDGKVVINLVNDEIEKVKDEKVDKLILTYVYSEDTEVSEISSKVVAEGKLYNGKKAVSEETIYKVENVEEFGEIIQIRSNIQEIYRTELKEENQEFLETIQINLNYKNLELMDKIVLSENSIKAYTGEIDSDINTKYIATIINKQELLSVIGETGELLIKSGGNEICKINKETESNESGNIVINYEEEISNVTVEILLGNENASLAEIANNKFNIIHKKEIEKCSKDVNYDKIIKEMSLSLAKDEEVSKILISSVGEIKDKTTKAELGLDKQELTATKENELTATITLHTENKKYDLNKNPRYEIVLPKEIENVELGDITILNNKDFKIKENQIVENNNGQRVIVIILEGEQVEYTETAGNVQAIIPLKINTSKLIPTTISNIELYYTNEIAESYETTEDFGKEVKEISIIADKDLIVATEVKTGEEEVISYKTDVAILEMEKTENIQTVEIKGTIINNTDVVKENIKIVGENELLNEITLTNGNVYYSETIEGPWADTLSEGQKYFKIEIEKLEIGEKLEFTYNMQIPEDLEETKIYEAEYKVFEKENLSKESKVVVAIEVEKKESEIPEGEVKIDYKSKVIKYGGYEIENVEIDSQMVHEIYINNYTQEDKNTEIKIKIPKCIDTTNLTAYLGRKTDEIVMETGENWYEVFLELEPIVKEDEITYIFTAPANTELNLYLELSVEKYIEKEVRTDINVYINDEEINFEDIKTAITPAIIDAEIKAYINERELEEVEEIKLQKGEQIKYITTVKNKGETTERVEISYNNIQDFKILKSQIYKNDKLIKELGESEADKIILERIEIAEEDELKIVFLLELVSDIEEDKIIEQYAEIKGYVDLTTTNKITTKLLKYNEEPDIPQEPIIPEEPEEKEYTISGIAWLDKEKNGEQNDLEDYLNGIEVILLNAATNQEVATVITDMNGKYEFKNVGKGKYFIMFGYNTSAYNLTAYKKSGVEETKNSDAILTTQDGLNVAKTEVIEILNDNISNIDIGVTLKEIFDLEVTKQIKKVTIKNNEGQTVYEYQNTDFTKIEIPSKYFKGTNIIIEYEVQIVNKGDISGYVKTLTDHKPEGLKFASELNNSWYEGTDGELYCIEFGEDEIKPGETREVSLVLTKEITDTQIQYITNEVELEEVFNEYLTTEKDTNNNKAKATLIVAIKTGTIKTYLVLWIACAMIISVGIYVIKGKVIIKR